MQMPLFWSPKMDSQHTHRPREVSAHLYMSIVLDVKLDNLPWIKEKPVWRKADP
jgi:hypothetical protein